MASDYAAISRYNEDQLGKDRKSRMSQVAMYTDAAHFVYELIQNADDVHATKIVFILKENALVVEHNGTPFGIRDGRNDVEAISYFGKGKTDVTAIGHFGLGFKSVFAYTASPRVHSGEESFEITHLYSLSAAPYPPDLQSGHTRFVLPFDHQEKQPDYIERGKSKTKETAYSEIERKLAMLSADTLLFTRSIREIAWRTIEKNGHYKRYDHPLDDRGRETSILTEEGIEHCFLVFDQPVQWENDDGELKGRLPVQIAFKLGKSIADGGLIEHVENARLSVFFPTDKETHIGFTLQGPYRTTPNRGNLPPDDEFNRYLVLESAQLLAACLPHLKELGLLDLHALEALPIQHTHSAEGAFLRPLHICLRKELLNEPLLPAAYGGYIAAKKAKLARGAAVIEMFPDAWLARLYKAQDLRWLDKEITKDNYPDLYRFLVGEWGKYEWQQKFRPLMESIEVDPQDVVKLLDHRFMSDLTENEVVQLYSRLDKQVMASDDFKKALLNAPIVRIELGEHVEHVVPAPNEVFLPASVNMNLPTVKRSLIENAGIREFMERLDIKKPDLVDYVINKVLPKYNNPSDIAEETWCADFQHILAGLKTDSNEQLSRLKSAMQDAAFLLVVDALTGDKAFSKPATAYLNTDEIKEYFSGCEKIYLLAPDYYQDDDVRIFQELGVAKGPRIIKRKANHHGHITISNYWGDHKRGRDGFDPDWSMDGLENALEKVTPERSQLLWNFLLSQYQGIYQCIRGVIESSTHEDYKKKPKLEEIISKTGKLLMDTPWLPDKQGNFHVPRELALPDLPDGFDKIPIYATELAEKIGMRKLEVQQALELLSKGDERKSKLLQDIISADDALLDKIEKLMPKELPPPEFKSFKEGISATHRQQKQLSDDEPATPGGVRDPELYGGKLGEEVAIALKRVKTNPRTISFDLVRTGSNKTDSRIFLYKQYAGKCQVTGYTFSKANGQNYFEAVYLVSRLDAEHLNTPGNMICLSADTAARFLHASFEWMESLEEKIMNFQPEKYGGTEEHRQVSICLGGKDAIITWSEQHFMRLIALWNNA